MEKKRLEQLLREERGISHNLEASVRAVLVFPNSYYLGMSNLGFQVILDEINRHPDVSCERAFFDIEGLESVPRSLETQRPLSEFDIVGFSISFELDYFNVVRILHAAKLPLRSKDRECQAPLIIAGGICPSFNPEPLSDFVDAFVIGDGEEVIHRLLSEYQYWRQSGSGWESRGLRSKGRQGYGGSLPSQNDRQEFLHRLSEIEGVYVPLLYDVAYGKDGILSGMYPRQGVKARVSRSSLSELDRYDTASKILTPNTEFANSFLVEVTRGCAHRCRFCVASYIQKCRMRSKDAILKLAQSELAQNAEKIGLLGSSVGDHPQIDEIAASLVDMGSRISIASIRADSVSHALLDALASSGQKTITLAPEAASKRLREVIGKNMPMEVMFEVIRSALKRGILNVKLYFMVGLPTETSKDVDNIVTLVKRIRQLMLNSMRPRASLSPRLTVSISPFVPKPHTPFQWCEMEDVKTLSQKLQLLRRKLIGIGGIRIPSSSARWSAIQGAIARGDRRLANVLRNMIQKSISWNQALKKNGLSMDFYLRRPRCLSELFPWDYLNLGIPKARLAERFLDSV